MTVTLSNEQRQEIEEYGTPLPIFEPDEGRAYVLLPVKIGRTKFGDYRATVLGMKAIADADVPTEAVFALCLAIQKLCELDE